MKPLSVAVILGLALTACAAPPPPPPKPKPDVTDGFYRGTSTRFQANNRSCPRPGLVTIQVWDRKFQYRWTNTIYIDAVVMDDGSVQGQGPGISLLGQYTQNRIEGDVTNGDCGLHFTVTLRDK